jgi:hypothetical protein
VIGRNEILGPLLHTDQWLTPAPLALPPWGPSGRWDAEVDRRARRGAKDINPLGRLWRTLGR